MSFLTALPIVGGLLEKLVDRLWPDMTRRTEKALDIELEEVRQSGGRVTPRMLLKYVVVLGVSAHLGLSLAVFFVPDLGPPPEWLREMLTLAGLLFGFGG